MNQKQIKEMLKAGISEMTPFKNEMGEWEKSVYLGSYLNLDPCGRYHHILSPNGVKRNCEIFWESMDRVASDLGGYIFSGEGDPLDISFGMALTDKEISDLPPDIVEKGGY